MESTVPVIDFSFPDRQSTAKQLTKALETVGFVYLDNVPGFNKEVENVLHQTAEWFFSISLEEKLQLSTKNWNKDAKNVFRGYIPIDVDKGHLREQYGVGELLPLDDPDLKSGHPLYERIALPTKDFPVKSCLNDDGTFGGFMMSYYYVILNVGVEFLRLMAIGLGLPEDSFASKFVPKSISTLRLMHYPTYFDITGKRPEQVSEFTCEEHIDTVFVTLLVTFSYPGLEIQREDGLWIKVTPRPGSLIVNIGDLMSRVTNGRFRATPHRVRDTGKKRYSVPFFLEARSNAKFEFPDSSIITYGPWLVERLRRHKYQFAHLPPVIES